MADERARDALKLSSSLLIKYPNFPYALYSMKQEEITVSVPVIWRGKKFMVTINSRASLKEFGDEVLNLTDVRADTLKLIIPQSSAKPDQPAIPLLIPHQFKALPNYMVLPHYIGRRQAMDVPFVQEQLQQKRISTQDSCPDSPSQNIPLLLPQDCQRFGESDGPNMNNYGHD